MAKKFFARIERDIVREIKMGALVVAWPHGAGETVIDPPRVHLLPAKAGTVAQFKRARDRDAYVAAINAENPDAAVAL